NYQRRGLAHWIGPSWKGHKTTSGEMFDPGRLTGAHDTLPLPSFLYVTNRANGRTILIRVNDRVNAGRGSVIVVSELAADLLGFRTEGRAEVDIQYAGPAAERPNGKHEEAFLMKQPWFHRGLINVNHAPDGNGGVATASGRDRYVAPNYPRWDNTRR
ncbi:MAG: hypothetical protein KKB37_07100, partial [Alphaproteobacteria bacterium]|nr:hypothetical protein [Alphaproteobacteria bacterium]